MRWSFARSVSCRSLTESVSFQEPYRRGTEVMNKDLYFTPREREQYDRHMKIADIGEEGQRRLKKATLFIAGAGGLGTVAASYLAAAGVGKLRICDNDRVSLSNLNRQTMYGHASLGKKKAAEIRKRLSDINPHIEIDIFERRLDSSTADEMIGEADLIIDCLDTLESRLIINDVSIGRRVPVLHGSLCGYTGHVCFLSPPATPCLYCLFQGPFQRKNIPVLGPVASIIGSLQSLYALFYIIGKKDSIPEGLVAFDSETSRLRTVAVARDPACPKCSSVS